jgi:hypothetical protein
MKTFTRGGVRIQYPLNWTVETDDDGPAWSANLVSKDTAFVLASLRPDAEHPAELADEALAVLKAEYKDLDADPVVENIAGQPAVGYDVDFLAVDTSVVSFIRGLNTPDGPMLLLAQVSEYDRERNEPLLRAVIASVQIEDE